MPMICLTGCGGCCLLLHEPAQALLRKDGFSASAPHTFGQCRQNRLGRWALRNILNLMKRGFSKRRCLAGPPNSVRLQQRFSLDLAVAMRQSSRKTLVVDVRSSAFSSLSWNRSHVREAHTDVALRAALHVVTRSFVLCLLSIDLAVLVKCTHLELTFIGAVFCSALRLSLIHI